MNATKQATHTPGPWHIHLRNDDDGTVATIGTRHEIGVTYTGVCDIHGWGLGYEDSPEMQANARLIAAAPDLLAVCLEIDEHGTDDWEARMRTLRAALARVAP